MNVKQLSLYRKATFLLGQLRVKLHYPSVDFMTSFPRKHVLSAVEGRESRLFSNNVWMPAGACPRLRSGAGMTVLVIERTLLLGVFLIVTTLLGTIRSVSAQSVVKIGFVPSESFAPLFVAHERGHFKAQGLTTELVRLPSGAAILTQVSTGDLQVGGGALGAAAFNAAHQKLPVAFVAPMHYAYNEDYLVIRKAEIDAGRFKSVSDLRGKPCAINAKGVATEWVLDEVLQTGGLRIENIDVKTLPFPEMLPALDNGAIHCGIITEPFATQAEEKSIGLRPLKAKAGAKPVPITVAFWNSDWAKKNDGAAKAFIIGYLRAVRELSEPNAWRAPVHLEILSKHTGVGADVLTKTRPPVFSPNLELEDKVMMSQQEFNLRLGYLKYKEMKPIKDLVDLSYAEAAVKQAGRK